jgi:NADH:ubiquinone oxidoreductase subunit F (NADH-binding)/NADH:ubiquinone oxidoreductase subunit E
VSHNLVTLRRKQPVADPQEAGRAFKDSSSVLDRLRAAMDEDRVLTRERIARIAKEAGIPEAIVYGVATYYGDLSLQEKGETRVHVCVGTACIASCGDAHVRALESELGVKLGETRADGRMSLEPVYCLGLCNAAPAVLLDRHTDDGVHVRTVLGNVDGVTAKKLAALDPDTLAAPEPRPVIENRAPEPIVLRNIVGDARDAYRAYENRGAPEQVLESVTSSMLRGRGGAGFSTAQKWKFAAAQPAGEKWVVCNADEGDPGSYIDKWILELDPHAVIEGMALAAHAIGATHGAIYIRSEYPRAIDAVKKAVKEAPLHGFELRVVEGAGSYVCGEETALLRSIEGLRGMVTARPPYPAEKGVFEKPTIVNNVETLANIPWIVAHGGDAYAKYGKGKSRGTKAISLNQLFARPGLYEVEMGIPLREILFDIGGGLASGKDIKAVQIGGPLGGILPPSLFDTAFGFEELDAVGGLLGHGGIVAFADGTDMREVARHLFEFGDDESCGKCFPCRIGMRRGREMIGDLKDLSLLNELLETMRWGSLCAHGGGLPIAIESIVKHWPGELLR